jgi:hypothetical protein
MHFTNNDLPVLTVRELNRVYVELRERLADYDGIHVERLHARLQAAYDELHGRALAEHIGGIPWTAAQAHAFHAAHQPHQH